MSDVSDFRYMSIHESDISVFRYQIYKNSDFRYISIHKSYKSIYQIYQYSDIRFI